MTALLALESFDAGAVDEAAGAEALQQAAIMDARSAGYDEGFEAGKAAGVAEADEANTVMTALCRSADKVLQEADQRAINEVANAVEIIATRLFPILRDTAFPLEAVRFASELSSSLADGVLVLRVHPDMAEAIRPLLGEASGRIELETDETFELAAAEADWRDGGAKMDIDGLFEKLIGVLNDQKAEGCES